MKKLLIPALLAASLLPLASHAACFKNGTIVRITAYDDSFFNGHYIYMRTSSLSSTHFYVKTTDDNMAEIATSAMTNLTFVSIRGDRASCPTSGSIGNLDHLIVNP